MALRIEKTISAFLILCGVVIAQPFTYEVRHRHLHGGAVGTLRISQDSIAFEEKSKNAKHSREWKYADIQQLSLSPLELRILTYEDRKWQFGRDREYVFDRLPEGLAQQAYGLFHQSLDQRFIAELSDPDGRVLWQTGAKLRRGLSGSDGTLRIGEDRIIFETGAGGESRTWRFTDIDNISTAGSFDLAITTTELSRWLHAGHREFRFQLKQALPENRYNDLWRHIKQSKRATD
jgi:hypothetical protein